MPRWYYRPGHPKADEITGFVSAKDLEEIPMEPPRAINAPVMSGRFYENAAPATDGTPIDSRSKHKAYMKAAGLAHMSDYGAGWNERVQTKRENESRDRIRETVTRLVHKGPKSWSKS